MGGTDVNVRPAKLSQIAFASKSASASLQYYFLDSNGTRVGVTGTLSLASSTVVPFPSVPDGAVAVALRPSISDDVCFALADKDGAFESYATVTGFNDLIPNGRSVMGRVY